MDFDGAGRGAIGRITLGEEVGEINILHQGLKKRITIKQIVDERIGGPAAAESTVNVIDTIRVYRIFMEVTMVTKSNIFF